MKNEIISIPERRLTKQEIYQYHIPVLGWTVLQEVLSAFFKAMMHISL
jgi:hypothetical protein